jgi:DNA-binding MarR family transcriptional regulator
VSDSSEDDGDNGSRGVLAFYRLSRSLRSTGLPLQLTWERLSALCAVAAMEPVSISVLSDLEEVTAPTMSRTVSALRKSALVRCVDNQNDGRSVLVSSTAKGRAAVAKGVARSLEQIAGLLGRLDAEELEAIAELLRTVRKAKIAK